MEDQLLGNEKAVELVGLPRHCGEHHQDDRGLQDPQGAPLGRGRADLHQDGRRWPAVRHPGRIRAVHISMHPVRTRVLTAFVRRACCVKYRTAGSTPAADGHSAGDCRRATSLLPPGRPHATVEGTPAPPEGWQ